MAVGVEWAARITTVAAGFGVPALLGYAVDRRLGIAPAGVMGGMVLGFAAGMMQLLRIARAGSGSTSERGRAGAPPGDQGNHG